MTAPSAQRPPEEDRLPYLRLTGVLFAVLALFGLAVYLAWRIQVAATDVPPAPIPEVLGEPAINSVNQLPFENDVRYRRTRREKIERLRSYGWVLPDAGVVHIPIEVAMQLLIARSGGMAVPAPDLRDEAEPRIEIAPERPPEWLHDGGSP